MYPSAIRLCLRFEKWGHVTIGRDVFLLNNGPEFETIVYSTKRKRGEEKETLKRSRTLTWRPLKIPAETGFCENGAR
jgi:hypothetical protein